jgi:hypothetical protein
MTIYLAHAVGGLGWAWQGGGTIPMETVFLRSGLVVDLLEHVLSDSAVAEATLAPAEQEVQCSDEKVANRNAKVWHGATEWSLNDGQIPNFRGVSVHVSTGNDRGEGNRRASRYSRVSDLHRKP